MSNVDDAGSSASGTVLIPAGRPIEDAAAWVGHACWAELRFHEVLTGWLAVEADPELSQALWAIRSHRAELAEQWHRRLPELRERPRQGWVRAGDHPLIPGLESLAELTAPDEPDDRAGALSAVLADVEEVYRARQAIAVGPADRPTASTLARAIEVTAADGARIRCP